jgi:putative ABC transport system ATP-binding protein
MEKIVDVRSLTKIYRKGGAEIKALDDVSLEVKKGEFISIMGPSGSGKSTLMNMMGCLDRPTSGDVIIDGMKTSKLNDDQLADIRCKKVGFIFQTFNLIPRMNALKNVSLPMAFAGIPKSKREEMAMDLLEKVGLGDRLEHFPSELSSGEQQRVAIARAMANDPSILLADEPTGNLDTAMGNRIMEIMAYLNEGGETIVVVTHDPSIAGRSKKVFRMKDGRIE